jgi:hypothetical protein
MPYRLRFIKQEQNESGRPARIPLEDWKKVVSTIEGIRLCPPTVLTGKHPKTGDVINIVKEGDVEVYFPAEQTWHRVFRWSAGNPRFTVTFAPGDRSHPTWAAAIALASSLGALIQGEKKELYDLQTGRSTPSSTELDIDYSTELREYRIKFERVRKGEQAYPSYPENLGLRSKLGGRPDWVQGNNDTPSCPKCREPMSFVGQIDSIEHNDDRNPHKQNHRDQDFMFGDVGMIYVFLCFECGETQSVFQGG